MNVKYITNNPMIIKKGYKDTFVVVGNTLSVLLAAKYEIRNGYQLASHPLTSSIRPDISPYKTIILTHSQPENGWDSLKIINYAIDYTENLLKNHPKPYTWDKKSLKDFQYIDMDVINSLKL